MTRSWRGPATRGAIRTCAICSTSPRATTPGGRAPPRRPNFLSIVVSYGRNQIPGGSASGDELSEYPQIRQMAEKYMLFKVDETGAASFVALEPPDTDHQTDPDRYNNDPDLCSVSRVGIHGYGPRPTCPAFWTKRFSGPTRIPAPTT